MNKTHSNSMSHVSHREENGNGLSQLFFTKELGSFLVPCSPFFLTQFSTPLRGEKIPVNEYPKSIWEKCVFAALGISEDIFNDAWRNLREEDGNSIMKGPLIQSI